MMGDRTSGAEAVGVSMQRQNREQHRHHWSKMHWIAYSAAAMLVLFLGQPADARQASPLLACPAVQLTQQFSFLYGSVTLDALPAPAGSIVEAKNASGDTVGCQTVTVAGEYPLMYVYGEEIVEETTLPGMRDGELIAFTVNGQPATPAQAMVWRNDWSSHRVDLAAVGVPSASAVIYLPAVIR